MAKSKKPKRRETFPRCKAFLICQSTITEAETNDLSIIRIITNFRFQEFPSETPPFTVYARLVGGFNRYKMVIQVQDLHDGQVVASGGALVDFVDRVGTISLMILIESLTLSHAAAYDVVLLADENEIDRQQFTAVLEEESPDEHGGQEEEDESS